MPVKRTRLAARRKVVGFSQDKLAERLQVDHSTVVRWENGDSIPQPWKRIELARALQVSAEQLEELLTEQNQAAADADYENEIRQKSAEVIGMRLRAARKERAWTARRMAEKLRGAAENPNEIPHVDPSLVRMVRIWEKGDRKPSETYRLLYCKVLEIGEDELFCEARQNANGGNESSDISVMVVAGGPQIPRQSADFTARQFECNEGVTSSEFQPDIIEAVKRREFLVELAASAGLGAAGLTLETVRHGLNLSVAEERSGADADEWNEIALEYGESYLTTAPSDLLKPLMVDVIGLQSALQRSSDVRSQRELMRVAALLSAFTAQTLMNMGKAHEARRWWRTAKNSADRSGDPYSILWVRAREINRADEYRPVGAILPLVEEAERYVDQAPRDAVLEFLCAKALTVARVGRPHDANNVIVQLRECSSGLGAESGSLLAGDQARVHGVESFVYSRLGDFKRTESAYEITMELRGSGNLRWAAGNELKLAFCLVRKGDITEGLGHARTVLAQLPEQYRAQYLVSDAHELARSIPASGRPLNAAHEYREWLDSL